MARGKGTLPPNVSVHEFFLTPGRYLNNVRAQRDYIASNYTHAFRDMLDRGVNVIVQMVCPGGDAHPGEVSLSCNPDITLDLVPAMRERGEPCIVVGESNDRLPFMYGDAVVPESFFDLYSVPPDGGYTLFGPPKAKVSFADYAIGLYSSALVRDGGTLQVGIGSMGDATVYGLLLRQRDPQRYAALLGELCDRDTLDLIGKLGGLGHFDDGLYGASEMLIDGFVPLFEQGVLKRRVYDDPTLQRLLDAGTIDEIPSWDMLMALVERRAIRDPLDAVDVAYLRSFGVLREGVVMDGDELALPDGSRCSPHLAAADTKDKLSRAGLGEHLLGASVAHGGFFLGPRAFYDALRAMPDEQRRLLKMTHVARINELYGGEELDRAQRRHARFINSSLMVTLNGAVVSETLADGRVVSGVGGQYNFVAMAHALDGGRSIIKVRATRSSGAKTLSNIVYSYAQCTIPRHLRDIVVTEYGIADLRGKTDEQCIAALLNVADSRFQPELLAQAQRVGKIGSDYQVPEAHRHNLPQILASRLEPSSKDGLFPPFPFGTDLTDEELALGRALGGLKEATVTRGGKLRALLGALTVRDEPARTAPLLKRMGLDAPRGVAQRLSRRLVTWALLK